MPGPALDIAMNKDKSLLSWKLESTGGNGWQTNKELIAFKKKELIA